MPGLRNLESFDRSQLNMVETPYFIYDIESIAERISAIKIAFRDNMYTQYYPIKANPCLDIVRCCVKNGLGLDACSIGDLAIADILNLQPENISFTGVGLSEQEMRFLYRKKITPNIGSLGEIKRWAQLFPASRIGIRVSTSLSSGFDCHSEYSLKTGILLEDWPKIQEIVMQNNLEIVRLHRHESKNSISHEELSAAFLSTFEKIPRWVWKNIKAINFGGGWGLPYLREGQLDVEKLIKGIVDITHKLKTFTASGMLKIEIEPGEFLVGESGYILTRVIDVRKLRSSKMGKNIQVVILDTPFPVTSGARKPELLPPVEFAPEGREENKESVFTIIYGRSNTSMDIISKGMYLPAVNVGNFALVQCVGAYVPILLSYFNEQDIPAEFVFKNGELVKSRNRLKFKSHYKNIYIKGDYDE